MKNGLLYKYKEWRYIKMEKQNIEVPTHIVIELEMVRRGGKYNMFDSQGVLNELYALGCYESVIWLFDENWKEGSFRSQVNKDRYAIALRALADAKVIAEVLSE